MIASPLVSVIVPVYNGEIFLAAALDSIVAQTYRPLEIIVIDDGSTDGSASIAQTYDLVRYTFQTHSGLSAALNQGISLARADYFAFLDADDLWAETKLEKQMTRLLTDPALDMVFAHVREFRGDAANDPNACYTPTEGYSKGTLVVRRASFFRVGLFDTRYRVGDFIDWYIRATELKLESEMLKDVLLERRLHENNMGIREMDQRRAYLQILKKSLDRRQQSL
ncbi:MAG: glycosyltransferase family 2 protein [Anaerolineae bacterium]|nr:glycosyltransferase family 2 protein [Anaerolineae bacterium]